MGEELLFMGQGYPQQMDLDAVRCKNRFLNSLLIEEMYKCFAIIFDTGDDEVFIPAVALAVGGYLYKIIWLYAAAGSYFVFTFLYRWLYRWYIVSAAYSFVASAKSFDSCISSVISAIREREIISFGILMSSDGSRCCNRVLRIEAVKSLRELIRSYGDAAEKLANDEEREKLLRRFFTDAMNELAVSEVINEHILQLSAIKDLSKVLSLVRSEYVRLLLFRLTEVGAWRGIRLCCGFRRFKVKQNKFGKRFTESMKYIFLEEDESAIKPEYKIQKPEPSTSERASVQLGLALQILQENDSEENKKKVLNILNDTVNLIKFEKNEKVKKSELSSSPEVVEGPTTERTPFSGKKVFEGVAEAQEEIPSEPRKAFYTKLQHRNPMTNAVVRELKNVIGSRRSSTSSSDEELKVLLDRSSDSSNSSLSLQDSSVLSPSSSSEVFSLTRPQVELKKPDLHIRERSDPFGGALLKVIKSRSTLPETNYGDSDDD
ncbi:unnamed protein product [Enterobius vermicularis]|uniref:Vezatin n=1 Tax=Enterobius vermicularis TaxID=51028 RepID=A0A158Q9M8_ENTVE|nr:unnamed protein product [Enterobius vermicularis]